MCDVDRLAGYRRSRLPFRQLNFRLPEFPDDLLRRVSLLPHLASLDPAEILTFRLDRLRGLGQDM